MENIEGLGLLCLGHTSYSHKSDKIIPKGKVERYRLIFLLSRAIQPCELKPLGQSIAEKLHITECYDKGALEPSRLYYFPRCPKNRKHLFQYHTTIGYPIEVDEVIEIPRSKDLQKPKHHNKSSFKEIIRKTKEGNGCNFVSHVSENQESISEPEWRAGLSIAQYCHDRDTAIHEMSHNYPNYKFKETEQKSSGVKGPYTCEKIRSLSSACEGCKLQIKSPIVLGLKTEKIQTAEISYEDVLATSVTLDSDRKIIKKYAKQLKKGFYDKYGMLLIEGKAAVIYREYSSATNSFITQFSHKSAISTFHQNTQIPLVSFDPRDQQYHVTWKNIVDIWHQDYYRKSYKRPLFKPLPKIVASDKMPPSGDYINLFIGHKYLPVEGDCTLILRHIREVWCDGNTVAFEYVLNWLARMVQKPNEQGRTVIVLRSGQGAGKNIILDIFDRYYGSHATMITKLEDLIGFNDHLAFSVFVFLNEALWGRNRAIEGAIKSMITDDSLSVERKYVPKFKTNNCTHIVAATNNDWAAPVDIDDRRFFMLDLNEKYKDNYEYFDSLVSEIKSGGEEAFIYHLLNNVDISDFNVGDIPEIDSDTKLDHKVRTMDSITRWWLDVLNEGGFDFERNKDEIEEQFEPFMEWQLFEELIISRDIFYRSYEKSCRYKTPEAKASVTKKNKRVAG